LDRPDNSISGVSRRSRLTDLLAFNLFLACSLLFGGCVVEKSPPGSSDSKGPRGIFFRQSPPDSVAELFAPGVISTENSVRDFAISPGGDMILYTLLFPGGSTIVQLRMIDSAWTSPEVAPFSGMFTDLEPAFSPDGKRLYFVSKRPVSDTSVIEKDADIWYVDRISTGWSEPQNVGQPINTDADEFYPSLTTNGDMYYTAQYGDSEDIWVSRRIDGTYADPERLPETINTDSYEFNAYVHPDGSYIVFSSYGRDDGYGSGDLYVSFKDRTGSWMEARNLGEKVNGSFLDFCPTVHGKYLFYTSNRYPHTLPPETPLTMRDIERRIKSLQNGTRNLYWVRLTSAFPSR